MRDAVDEATELDAMLHTAASELFNEVSRASRASLNANYIRGEMS